MGSCGCSLPPLKPPPAKTGQKTPVRPYREEGKRRAGEPSLQRAPGWAGAWLLTCVLPLQPTSVLWPSTTPGSVLPPCIKRVSLHPCAPFLVSQHIGLGLCEALSGAQSHCHLRTSCGEDTIIIPIS